jgi:hypothetical protein
MYVDAFKQIIKQFTVQYWYSFQNRSLFFVLLFDYHVAF